MADKLVIFDWSGTLSPGAVLFAEQENLTGELEKSGLAALGVSSPELFWDEIVNPTWQEGSTTQAGYGALILRRIRDVFSPAVSDHEIGICAARFVESYLLHSSVDGLWVPLLKRLCRDSSVITVIATDHYAEATACIVRSLGRIGIKALPIKEACGALSFAVANSADLGANKASDLFWEAIKGFLNLNAIQKVLIVDDFGFNEEEGDSYGERRKVEARKEATLDTLERTFGPVISLLPFMWERSGDPERDDRFLGSIVMQTSELIEKNLSVR